MKVKFKFALALVALVVSAATMAQTAAPAPDYTLSYNVGAVSDYRFRGMAQTAGGPAVQGGVDFAHKSGLYLGAWGSNVNWIKDFNLATKGTFEIDLYGGYKGEIAAGVTYDLGAITYQYPGNNSGAAKTPGAGSYSNASTTEFYGALTYSVVTLKYSQSLGDFLGNLNSRGSRYIDLSANFDIGNGFTLTPHMGRQTVPNQSIGARIGNAADCNDYSLTLAKDFGNGFSGSVAAISTNAYKSFYTDSKARFLGKDALVVGVKYSF
ncbi:TorF family putative porin [Rhodoferax sp.]|uniref:TorF family putative porin n=1 Tax=Rhodoferax sp. TaxID=50421 RepID=UPI00276D657A|nr:TorF family putative porin [Rhodoferax sp.]